MSGSGRGRRGKDVETITLVLADDHRLVSEAVSLLLRGVPDFYIAGTAGNGAEAVLLTKQLRPKVVLMDLAMPLLDGVSAAREVLRALPRTKILMMSAFVEPSLVRAAIEVGAAGFIFKGCSSKDLCRSIYEVQKGGLCFPSGYNSSAAFKGRFQQAESSQNSKNGNLLTEREVEVLRLVAQGKANKQIADELGISVKTVEKHRQGAMDKLGIHQTAGLTRYALAAGLV